MAVTENLHTGNGSKTNYSFTFPYLKTTDIKASIDGTVVNPSTYTAGSPTATEIQFNTAPANNAAIRIYRDTATDNLSATFYAGSAIKSEDLNDNFLQNLYVTQEAKRDADAAWQDGDETINSTETWHTSDDTKIATTKAVENRIDAKQNTKLADDLIGGTDIAIADNDNAGSSATGKFTINHSVTGANSTVDNSGGTVLQDITISAQGHVTAIGSYDLDNRYYTQTQSNTNYQPKDAELTELATMGSTTAAALADLTEAEVQILDGATVTTTQLNVLNGIPATLTATELGYVDGVTSSIQTQIDGKQADSSKLTELATMNADTASALADLTQAEVQVIDGVVTTGSDAVTTNIINNALGGLTSTKDELNVLDGLTLTGASAVNTSQINKLGGLNSSTTELNILHQKTFKDSSGTLNTTSDTEIPSSKVIAAHVASSQTAIGGFVTIADEVSFPATASMPANGVVVSINNAAGIVVSGSSPYTSTTGRTTDGTPATVTINNFPSSLAGETLAAGVGLIVTATSTSNTYNYHKILAAETDVKQLSDDINDFNARYRVAGSAPGSNNDAGDMYFDTGSNKMKVYNGTTSTWDDVASVGNFYINTISSSSGTGGGSATFNGSAYRFTLSNAPTMAQQLIVSVNGVIQKPNAGTSQPSEGFAISGNDIIFSAAPGSGSDYFIVTQGSSVSIGTPSDNTVTSAKIVDGSIVNGDISSSANIAGSKVADDSITEVKLDVHNAPATGKYLKYTSNGMEWSDGASEGTDVKSTGESGGTKFLREDGDGTSSWQTVPSDSSKANLSGAAFTGNITFPNDIEAVWGGSSELQIGHDGTTNKSVIQTTTTDPLLVKCAGDLNFVYNSGGSEVTGGTWDPGGAWSFSHGSSTKLATTSTGINVTGAITVNGTALSVANEITTTASGAVAAGKTMMINSNGTASQITKTTTLVNPPTSTTSSNATTTTSNNLAMAFDTDNNRLLVMWRVTSSHGGGSNSTVHARAATVASDGTVTWGSDTSLSTSIYYTEYHICYATSGKFIFCARDGTTSGTPLVTHVITVDSSLNVTWGSKTNVSGSSITVGQGGVCAYHPPSGKVIYAYRDGNWPTTNEYAKVTYGTLSGTAVGSWGSTYNIDTTGGANFRSNGNAIVYDPDTEQIIVTYVIDSDEAVANAILVNSSSLTVGPTQQYDTGSVDVGCRNVRYDEKNNKLVFLWSEGNNVLARTATVNGTGNSATMTFGTETTVHAGSSSGPFSALACDNNGNFAMYYKDTGNSNYLAIRTGTINGTSIDMTNSATAKSVASSPNEAVYAENINRAIVLNYHTGSNNIQVLTSSISTTTSNSSGYIGIANTSASDGNSVTIRSYASTNNNQSSLTPGSLYYVQKDGTLATTADTPSVEAGVALSATMIMIKG